MKNLLKSNLMIMYLVAALPVLAYATIANAATTAEMLFVPASGTVAINGSDQFTVDIQVKIGTGNESAGADAVVQFDTADLEFISAEKTTTGNPTGFYGSNGLFTSTPAATANSTGVVEIGRTADPGSYATGTGIMATLTFKSKVAVGSQINLDFDFTAGVTTDSNVAGSEGGVDLLNSVTDAVLTIAEGSTTTPAITAISPTHGDKSLAQSIVITGTNFGTQGTNSKVYIGTKLATVSAWSDTQITIQVPSEPDLTASSTRQIKVHRDDAQEATYTGYTYDLPLPENGPEVFIYFGLAMSAFGLAGVSYQKLFGGKPKADEMLNSELNDSNL
ncbi:MAG: IPT/TIG domain-containing protein [Patescibacteria group bacterium]